VLQAESGFFATGNGLLSALGTGVSVRLRGWARLTGSLCVQSRMLVAMKLGSVVQFCSVGMDHDKDLPGCIG